MIRLVIHLEQPSPEVPLVWWAESPDLPGFSVMDDDLQGLIVRSKLAIEDGYPDLVGPIDFTYEMALDEEAASGDVMPTFQGQAVGADTANPSPRSATARLVSAGA